MCDGGLFCIFGFNRTKITFKTSIEIMISAFFLFNQRGDTLISDILRAGVKPSISDIFRIQVISNPDLRSPILTLGSTTFLHIKHNDLWLVAVTRSNSDVGVIFEWLYGFKEILLGYFGEHGLIEENIKEYFDVIYSLLDEVLQFGIPQNMDLSTLTNIVMIPPRLKDSIKKKSDLNNVSNKIIPKKSKKVQDNSDIPWRNSGIKYRRNEIFLDVYEKLNVLISSDGKILKNYVDGKILMKTQLSGVPVCDFGLNDTLTKQNNEDFDFLSNYEVKNSKAIPNSGSRKGVLLEDCKFHQCVELDKFDSDRIIQFIPPDGEFELMTYRCLNNINFPFKLSPRLSKIGNNLFELKINLKSLFPNKLISNNVTVKVPILNQIIIDVKFASSGGKSKFSSKDNCLLWTFKKFNGLTEHSLTATIKSGDGGNDWSTRPPINLDFELLMFSSSGIVVEHLRIQEENLKYNTIKWVRYISQGGAYEVRY